MINEGSTEPRHWHQANLCYHSGSVTCQLCDSGTVFNLSNFQVPKMVNEDNDTFTDLLKRLSVIIHVNCLTEYLAYFKYSTISDVIISVMFTFKINVNSLLGEKDKEH